MNHFHLFHDGFLVEEPAVPEIELNWLTRDRRRFRWAQFTKKYRAMEASALRFFSLWRMRRSIFLAFAVTLAAHSVWV